MPYRSGIITVFEIVIFLPKEGQVVSWEILQLASFFSLVFLFVQSNNSCAESRQEGTEYSHSLGIIFLSSLYIFSQLGEHTFSTH